MPSENQPSSAAGKNVLHVYEAGELTVVGFDGKDVPSDTCLAEYRAQLVDLVKKHNCKTLAFDLTGVKLVPSGLLGLIASVRNLGVEVQVFNPSADVREVFRTTHLDSLIEIREA